ncbi:hypothetical protein F5884DRAFT_190210 [Xylogone sp. PMI_703]|nr:hypothetical protein F5884DRAFT_190210 [Xylogone sp. PMI_703]
MATLQQALKSLGPTQYADLPLDNLTDYIASTFRDAQLIVDSVPIPAPPSSEPTSRERSSTTTSTASSASEISVSSARSSPPPESVLSLQKEWKSVKLNPKENPLGINVYKLPGSDGKGAWFARRSVHEGLGFKKWKRGLEMEFPETLKVQGGPGEGNIRGIGGERRIECKEIPGGGKMEVYQLSARFTGPTTPRDFVTLLITSDQALKADSNGEEEVPRHFMVVSKPCLHPDAPERQGYIRGQYESVEMIREIPLKRPPKRASSSINLGQGLRKKSSTSLGRGSPSRNSSFLQQIDEEEEASGSRPRMRGKTISFAESRGADAKGEAYDVPPEDDDLESNPVEWIMITRSDPGGSVPRFLVERGTPNGIVTDAGKFLDWCCSTDIEALVEEVTSPGHKEHDHDKDLHEYQTNGHLSGLESESQTLAEDKSATLTLVNDEHANNGGGASAANRTPGVLSSSSTVSSLEHDSPTVRRRHSMSSISTVSSSSSYFSALEGWLKSHTSLDQGQEKDKELNADNLSIASSKAQSKTESAHTKEMQKLEDKKVRLQERLRQVRERAEFRKADDSVSVAESIRKAEERYDRELKKYEDKYKREIEKLQQKQEKERKKVEERRRKTLEKDEKARMVLELEVMRGDIARLTKEKEAFQAQVGQLQAENTALAAKLGRLGEQLLKEAREEAGKGVRLRSTSLRDLGRSASTRSISGEFKNGDRRISRELNGESRVSLDGH